MKKLFLILITVFTSWLPSAVSQHTISADVVEACQGDLITVNLNIDDLTGVALLQFVVQWDPAVISYIDTLNNMPPLAAFGVNNVGSGQLSFGWVELSPPFGNEMLMGSMFSINFQVIGNYGSSTAITIDPASLIIKDGNLMPITGTVLVNGSVSISDNDPPTFTCPSVPPISAPFGTMDTVINNIGLSNLMDNCAIDTVYYKLTGATVGEGPNDASGTVFNPDTTNVTYFVVDEAGNIDSCDFDVIVNVDPFNPNATRFYIEDAIVGCGGTSVAVELGVVNFSPVGSFIFPVGFDISELTFNNITYNTGVVTSSHVSLANAGSGEILFSWFGFPGSLGDDSTSLVTIVFDIVSPMVGGMYDVDFIGINNIPSEAYDGMFQPLVPQTIFTPGKVTVAGDTKPEIVGGCPDRIIYADTDCSVPLPNYIDSLTFADDCTALVDLIFNQTPDSLTTNVTADLMVTVTVTDEAGNDSTCMFMVTFIDTIAPVPDISPLPNVTGECTATATPPTATDNCVGTVTGTTTDPLTYNTQGTFMITWIYDDGNGNTSTQTQTVIVDDVTAPVPDVANLPDVTGECSATVTGTPTATDNCEGPITGTTTDPLTYNTQGTFTINWTYDDGNGNTSIQMQTVIVDDVTAPVPDVANLPDVTGECLVTVTGTPTATDNCEGPITGTTTDPLTYNTQGTFTITWTYDDGNGNTSTQTQTVIVDDVTDPVPDAATLPDVTGECSATVTGTPTATDNCEGPITGTTTDPLTYNSQGTFTITWTFDDGNGNTSTQTQTVIVDDVTAPVPDVATLPDVIGECSATATPPTATDNCEGAIIGTTTDPTTYNTQGTFTITWTYDDGNGNTSTQMQTVIVDDTTAPVPDVANLPDVIGECSAIATAPTATDNCEGAITGTTTDPLTYNTQGTFTITWTYNDGNGNVSTQTQTVIVDDTTAPVPDVANLPDVTGECSATVTDVATATDNCEGAIIGTTTDPLTYNSQGTFTITWTYDDGNGNTSTQTQTVIVDDVTAPVPDIATLPTLTVDCSATVTGIPTATDNCEGAINGTTTDPLTYNSQGTFTITWTYDDGNGNISTQMQTVIVDDMTAPVPDVATLPDVTGECSATVTDVPTATDNCEGAIIGTTTDPLTYNSQGTFTITWTYDDGNGNVSTQMQTVIVDDLTDPTITCPGPQTIDADANCNGTIGAYTGLAVVDDNCSLPANIIVSQNIPSGTIITAATPITLTAQDEVGNTASCTFSVSVIDVTPPSITCPANQTVMIDMDCQATLDDYTSMATVSDNCSMVADISVTQDSVPGTIVTADTDITLTATDEAGNSATCTFKVILNDTEIPVITCPLSVTPLSADNNCLAALPNYAAEVTATDNCPGLSVVQMPPIGTVISADTTTVTYTATDAAGNSASCSFEVTLIDDTPPALVQCIPDTFLIADANCQALLPDFTAMVIFDDNCTDVNDLKITQVPPGGTPITSDTVVAVVALDSVGLISDTCFFLVELRDTTPPTITCPISINTNTGANNCGTTVSWPMPDVADNCSVDTVICTPISGSFFPVGDSTVTCTVMDIDGNTSSCQFTVMVNDGIAPFLDCPSDTTIFVSTGIVDTMIFNIDLDSLSDNCMVDTLYYQLSGAMTGNGDGDASGTSFVVGTTTVTYYAEDPSGNIDSCSFNVNVLQAIILDLDCPANYTVPTDDGECSAEVDTDAPGIDPLAGLDTIYYVLTGNTNGSGPDSVPDNQIFNIGETTVTYTAISITNDTSTCSFTVTVVDQMPPSISCPATITIVDNTTDSCGVVFDASLQLATATDNCPNVQVTYNVATGALLPIGTNIITATATDGSNLTASCTYQLMVRDTQPPDIINCPANIIVNNDLGLCGAAVTWTPPTATDNCGLLFIEPTPYEPGDTIPVGVQLITYTASDFIGNITECIFSVTVRDNEPPSLNPCPGNITVSNAPGQCSAVVTWPFIQPDDNCNVVSFVVLPQSGSTFPVGDTPVQAAATDQAGNVTVCSFTVTVNDTQFPTMMNVPSNFTVDNDPGECGAVVTWPAIVVNDNCGIDTFFCTAESGDFFFIGMNDVDCTVTDVNGNSVNMDFTITVRDAELPVVDCPGNITINIDGSVLVDPSGFIDSVEVVTCDSATITYNGITATDNCGIASIVQAVGPASGSTLGAGSHLLIYSIKDANANEVLCNFNINVVEIPDATADAFPNNPCVGEDVLFFTEDYTGAAYEWKDPMGNVISNDPSFTKSGMTVDMSGTYEVTITFPFNCVQTAQVDVTVFPSPLLVINHNDLLCAAAGTPLTLEAVDTAGANVTNYQWSTPGGAFFFGNPVTVNNPVQGTYSVTATTANGCTTTASTFVEISTVPIMPDLNGNLTEACIGQTIVLDGEEFSGPGIQYRWSATPSLAAAGINDINNHNNAANPTVPGTYTYYYFVTQGGCVSDSAEWTVVVEAYPTFTLNVDGATTCVDGTSDIVISAVTPVAGLDWSIDVNGNCAATQVDSMFTLSNVNANCSGLYEVTATSEIGCATTNSVNLSITNKPNTPLLQVTDDTICMGGSTTMFLTNTPSGANLLCYANGVQVSCAFLGNPTQVPATTTYGVQFDINGCTSDTTFVTVTVEPPLDIPITVNGDVTCVDGTGTVILSTPAMGAVYTWSGPCGTQVGNALEIANITAACSGVYSVSVTGTLGQCINIGNLQLQVTGMLDQVTAVQNGPACDGGDVSFCAEPDMVGATYTWRDPFGNIFSNERCPETPAISASTPYSVTVEMNGCISSDDTLVTVLKKPDAKPETVVGIVNTPQAFNVVVNDVLSSPNYSISVVQQPNHGNVSYNGDGVFTYSPQNGFRETDIMAYEICLDECPDLCDIAIVTILVRYPIDECIATTLITPNDDGINDEFVVSCLELGGCPNNQVFIFNQWGDQVFEAAPYNNTWKGTYNGKDLPDGTYFYIFQCDRETPAEKGFVMIYR